ncbi:hypothetical protein [Paenibacillus nasutitermitis]|uniref:Uncharacterized protein n=1 Tax=Paenibacillus nasutitermitis TaxID=1652958 RepID=A0A917DN78_9BACL|nr:hypothetical protein [Paenibacillus nasutitermitis]GGD50147.1 hypothetical protein GCM10010911_04630 [Paenibacillus nasutitermitis]
MAYKTAQLTNDAVKKLQQYESELSRATGEDIILIAYESDENAAVPTDK